MKLNTVMEYKHAARRFPFTTIQDPVTMDIDRQYYDGGIIRLTFVSASRRTPIIYTDVDLEIFDHIGEIVDTAGEPIDDQQYYVSFKNPVLNAFGYVDGYAYTLSLVEGTQV